MNERKILGLAEYSTLIECLPDDNKILPIFGAGSNPPNAGWPFSFNLTFLPSINIFALPSPGLALNRYSPDFSAIKSPVHHSEPNTATSIIPKIRSSLSSSVLKGVPVKS